MLPSCPFSTCVTPGISRRTHPEGEPWIYMCILLGLFWLCPVVPGTWTVILHTAMNLRCFFFFFSYSLDPRCISLGWRVGTDTGCASCRWAETTLLMWWQHVCWWCEARKGYSCHNRTWFMVLARWRSGWTPTPVPTTSSSWAMAASTSCCSFWRT